MAIGYNIALTLGSGDWTPVLRKSAANNLTMGSGGSTVTIPWVENAHSGSGDTVSKRPYTAVMASLAALMNDRAANGDPT